MKAKQNIQWAIGSRPQKFNREDGQWEFEMQAIQKRVDEMEKDQAAKLVELPYKEGDMIYVLGNIEEAGEIDPLGRWVKIRGHKHGSDCCKALPDWFKKALSKLEKEMKNGN